MSIDVIDLSRVLKLMYSDRQKRISLLREDIRNEKKKESGAKSASGIDFYLPFWADAKSLTRNVLPDIRV